MIPRLRGRTCRGHSTVEEAGSLLVEAVLGIALLATITTAVATLLPAALDAQVRADSQRAALMIGDTLLEADAAGIPASDVPLPPLPDALRVLSHVEHHDTGSAGSESGCASGASVEVPGTTVHVQHGGRTDGREVVLDAGPRASRSAPQGTRSIVLRTPEGAGWDLGATVLIGPDGTARTPGVTRPECIEYADVARGTSWVASAGEEPLLIDHSHVTLADRPIPVSIDARPVDRTLDLAPAGWLRVVIDAGGARLPDHVSTGPLRWSVRGDDANVAMVSGDLRPVHPGIVTASVTPCRAASDLGSSGTIAVDPGQEQTLEVPLAVVTVEGIGVHTDAWLELQRTVSCPDGVGRLPVIRYEGALHDAMRIALPRGEWDAVLTRPGASPLTPPARVVAVGTDTIVRIP